MKANPTKSPKARPRDRRRANHRPRSTGGAPPPAEIEIDEATYKDEEQEVVPYRYRVTSYGADYPVDSLVKRIQAGDITIPAFQRGFLWNLPKASRFVESLLLGLPVPGIFLARDDQAGGKLVVIDGQQRLRTLQFFYQGVFAGKEFSLSGLKSQEVDTPPLMDFEGQTYRTLTEKDRRQLDDSIIHATIVKQDEPSEDHSSIYHIFERLNTGGVTLLPQEIRACIFSGPFNDMLKRVNDNTAWRDVYGPVNKRMRDQELILRFFALYESNLGETYAAPMKDFLNKYMGKNRFAQEERCLKLQDLFTRTIDLAYEAIGKDVFRPQRSFNAAVFDSVMVGIAKRLSRGKVKRLAGLKEDYTELDDHEFTSSTTTGTTQEANVRERLRLAVEAFHDSV